MPYINTDPCSKPNPSPNNGFENLVQDLSDALGPSSGLDSDDIDPMDILRLMERYDSNPDEWLPFALGDSKKNYTRNLIDEGNGKSNLILKGSLKETLYAWPDQGKLQNGESSPPQIKKETIYGENQVTYMSDKLGLHRISNPDPNDYAVSLHLYTPPNAATHGFSIFDDKTGKACHIKTSHVYSVRGERC
ncbi:hypothetical protein AnigIFM59636_002251 [Aspergillus niger]|uniref:Cysteine dioxygenase n=1 Tax=Aspergillus niger TaxID=5061 RepID=A0A505I0N7_ASPNG|nr:Inosine-uridine preferring nucleoside hydrolase family protein [Aspergillus niger]GKZ90430.1 hypothetical protein AnigIFM59636_002251 [Aspergillus niger]